MEVDTIAYLKRNLRKDPDIDLTDEVIAHIENLEKENAALKDRIKELEMAKIDFIKNFTGVDKLQDRIKALESVLGKAKATTDTILHAESLCQPWESVSIDKTIDLLKQLSTEIEQTLKG